MKKNLKSSIATVIFVLIISVLPQLAFAQPDPGGDPDTGVPIDGGISLLVAAGIAYGAKKKYDIAAKSEK